jgi:hypothetical protein
MHPLTRRAITPLTILHQALANNRNTLSARSIAMLERETRLEVHGAVLVQLDEAEERAATIDQTGDAGDQ